MIMGRGAYDNTGTPKPKPPPKRPAAQDSATAWIRHAADRTPRSVDRLLRLRSPWSRRHRALRWYQLDVPNSGVQWQVASRAIGHQSFFSDLSVCKGTVIIVATEGQIIDVPPGSILENVVVQGSLRLLEH